MAMKDLLQDDTFYLIYFNYSRGFWFWNLFSNRNNFGLIAGYFITASVMSRPMLTILVGIPPIAWIVLAMIWFVFGDTTVIFTVVVASFPIIFVGSLQGK